MANRAVIIDILSDAKGFVKGSKDAEQAASGLHENVQQLGRTIVSTYAAKQVIDFGQQAVKAAVEDAAAQKVLERALINATGATADQVAATEDWITQTQLAKGVADTELRPALATLVGATKDVGEAQDLMGLAMDTARAKGVSLETAATAIAKAHDGNTTSLLKLVPGLKEAGEKSLDFATATQRLNEQVKGQADAWAQTDEGKLERMNLQWGEMQEQIGGALLPVMGKLIGIVTSVFDWFNSLDQGTQDLIVTVGLVVAGLYVGITALTAVRTAVTTLGISMQTAMPWLIGITVAIGAVAAAVAIFGDHETLAEKNVKDMTRSVLASSSALDIKTIALLDAADAAKQFGDAIFTDSDKQLRDFIANTPSAVKAMQDLGISMDDVVGASHNQADALKLLERIQPQVTGNAIDGFNGYGQLALALGTTTNTMQGTIDKSVELAKVGDVNAIIALKTSGNFGLLSASEQEAAEATLDAAAAAEEAAGSTGGLADEVADAATFMLHMVDATADLRKALDSILGPSMNLEEADRRYRDSIEATTASVVENGKTLDINTDAGRKNREAVQAEAQALLGQADAMVRSGSSTKEATDFVTGHIDQLRGQLEMLGLNEDEVDAYITQLGLTPENVSTSMELANNDVVKTQLEGVLKQMDGVDKGVIAEIQADIDNGQFEEATRKINELPNTHDVVVSLRSDGRGLRIAGQVSDFSLQLNARAAGGPVTAGVPYLVGEKRPELFVPDVSGYILPRVPESFGGGGDAPGIGGRQLVINNNRRDLTVGDLHQLLAMERLAG